MPGHKGIALLGMEAMDITEIDGADSLYEANGIIQQSEQNASFLFGCPTYYSTEGSSHCIRAMLYLTKLYAKTMGKKTKILAARNVHKTFVTAAALMQLDVEWLMPISNDSYLCCLLNDMDMLEKAITEHLPAALYLTSPDYLGNCADITQIANICRKHGVLLLVDNAHGAYLKFLPKSRHPIDLGADLCCDSAHKTLPALTGAAYLHLSSQLPHWLVKQAKDALAMFGSTSPSYLIMQSLDAVNAYLSNGYQEKLTSFLPIVEKEKQKLTQKGILFAGDEPLKWTIHTKPLGYTGTEFAAELTKQNIICEFADPDFIVFMLSCEAGVKVLSCLSEAILSIPKKQPIDTIPPKPHLPKRIDPIHQSWCVAQEEIPVNEAEGRILSALNVSCPPAVPIAVCGEQIDRQAIEIFNYYGITHCKVIIENK